MLGKPESRTLKRIDAYHVYLILEGAGAFLFSMIFAASSIYQVSVAGLSPLQLVLVGTVLELSILIFEVPTGIVADMYSRRLSIIIGYVLIGAGFLLEGSLPFFLPIILGQILWGIGYTFTSGATQAWISDEIGESRANRAFLRANQLGQATALLGLGAGALIGSLKVSLPIQVGGGLLLVLALSLAFLMPENGFQPALRKEQHSWQVFRATFTDGIAAIRKRRALLDILLIGLFFGLYSEGFDRLWTKLILDNFAFPALFQPVVWLSGLRAVGMILSMAVTEVAARRTDITRHTSIARALMGITIVLIASLVGFAQARGLVWIAVAYWVIYVSRNLIGPLYTAWVNQKLDPAVRATVLSMSSQVDAIGQVAGGPIVGLIGNLASVRTAITISSLSLTPILLLFNHTLRRSPETTSANLDA
ncbi:MAG: MFS transporter [Anaerolineales bacterium]|jgi:DHA3 family tetracycline resistance protein-like MFS transporter|nr:MFS transporter [Anaerolineales bacterium]